MPTITEGGLGGIALSQLASEYRFTHPAAHWGRLIDMGVNMIQTDYPAALLEYLETR